MSDEIVVDDNATKVDDPSVKAEVTEKSAEELKAELERVNSKNQELLGKLAKTKEENQTFKTEAEKRKEEELIANNKFKELAESKTEENQKLLKTLEQKVLRSQLEKAYANAGVSSEKINSVMRLSSDYIEKVEFDKETHEANADSLKSYVEGVLTDHAALGLTKESIAKINDLNPSPGHKPAKTFAEKAMEQVSAIRGV